MIYWTHIKTLFELPEVINKKPFKSFIVYKVLNPQSYQNQGKY